MREYEFVVKELDETDADLLNSKFTKYVSVDKYGDNQYKITASQFVGVIFLHHHSIIIRPKIENLNFSYVLSYANEFDVFRKEDFEYMKEHDESLFEQITRNLLDRVEDSVERAYLRLITMLKKIYLT